MKKPSVIIDPRAGFCPGVQRVIRLAEKALQEGEVHALGELIHNAVEMKRLKELGLQFSSEEADRKVNRVLLRAHGVPKIEYERLKKNNIHIIDGTCPIVRRSEKLAEEFGTKGYHLVFVGKKGHAETLSVTGHTSGSYTVVESEEDLSSIPRDIPLFVMAQTTKRQKDFERILERIRETLPGEMTVRNTICNFVKNRDREIREFASSVDCFIMVGGKNSSNTAWLYSIARENNPNSYWIEQPDEVEIEWVSHIASIGISGSASTPRWLMEKTAETIRKMLHDID